MSAPFLYLEIQAGGMKPRQRGMWRGYAVECERQARRTTFLRITDDFLDGARIQVKKSAPVTIGLSEDGAA